MNLGQPRLDETLSQQSKAKQKYESYISAFVIISVVVMNKITCNDVDQSTNNYNQVYNIISY